MSFPSANAGVCRGQKSDSRLKPGGKTAGLGISVSQRCVHLLIDSTQACEQNPMKEKQRSSTLRSSTVKFSSFQVIKKGFEPQKLEANNQETMHHDIQWRNTSTISKLASLSAIFRHDNSCHFFDGTFNFVENNTMQRDKRHDHRVVCNDSSAKGHEIIRIHYKGITRHYNHSFCATPKFSRYFLFLSPYFFPSLPLSLLRM